MTGVANRPSEVMSGSIWTRSRIWMMMLEMARATPAAKTTSMTMNRGTHRVASAGARPKITNRRASGIHEIIVFRRLDHMVSRGKHSRGNWVLASSALLDSRDSRPLPRAEEKKLQHRMPTKA